MVALQPAQLRAEAFSFGGKGSGISGSAPVLQAIQPRFGMGPRNPESVPQPIPGKTVSAFWPMMGSSLAVVILAAGTLFGLLTQETSVPSGAVSAKVEITTHPAVQPAVQQKVAAHIPSAPAPLDDVEETGSITPRLSMTPPPASAQAFVEPSVPAQPEQRDELAYNPDDMPMADIEVLKEAKTRASSRVQSASAQSDSNSSRTVRLNQNVRLRVQPNGKSRVLTTLAKGTELTLYGCKSWCEVESQRKRGYVYAKALNR